MNKKKKVSNKKKKSSIKKPKSCNNKCDKDCSREKVNGEPTKVTPCKQPLNIPPVPEKPLTYVDGEPYPKLVFKTSLWTKFLRFIGLDS